MWQVDRSDSVRGELNGFAMRRTTGRGSVVTSSTPASCRATTNSSDNVLGGFDAVAASGLTPATPCPDFPLAPCGNRTRYGHGTAVASAVAGLHSGVAPDAPLQHRHHSAHPPRQQRELDVARRPEPNHPPRLGSAHSCVPTAVVTMSIPATPRPGDPLYLALVERCSA
jgi:hypothetical protein